MQSTINRQPQCTSIALSGSITFREHKEFRTLIEDALAGNPARVEIDLTKVDLIDSAGLSLFVILHDRMAGWQGKAALKHPPAQVARMLEVVDFGQLFEIIR